MINLSVANDAETGCLRLTGDLTIYTIADAKLLLQSVVNQALDCSEVGEFDGAGLQLMMALCRDGNNHLVTPSEAVISVLGLTGQMELLDMPILGPEES